MSTRLSVGLLLAAALLGPAVSQQMSREAWVAARDARGVQVIPLECGNGYLDPHEIVVQAGVPVELVARSAMPGRALVSGMAPPQVLGPQAAAHRFTPPSTGRFSLRCDPGPGEPPGRARGVLTVVPEIP